MHCFFYVKPLTIIIDILFNDGRYFIWSIFYRHIHTETSKDSYENVLHCFRELGGIVWNLCGDCVCVLPIIAKFKCLIISILEKRGTYSSQLWANYGIIISITSKLFKRFISIIAEYGRSLKRSGRSRPRDLRLSSFSHLTEGKDCFKCDVHRVTKNYWRLGF